FGGVRNTSVPNYIYRWTEREVIKTISSYAPYVQPEALWFHEFEPPIANLKGRKSKKALFIMWVAYPVLWLITRLFKRQCNLFGFAILKPDLVRNLFPWLKLAGRTPAINKDWI